MGLQEEILYRNVDVRNSGRSKAMNDTSGFRRKPSRAKDHGHLGVTGLQHFLGLENESDSSGSDSLNTKHVGAETEMSQHVNNDVNMGDSQGHALNEGASSRIHEDAYKTYPVYRETNLDDLTSSSSPLTDSEKAAAFRFSSLRRTDSGSSVDSNGSFKKSRPPIPTPRPSVKGPAVAKKPTGSSFKSALTRTDSSDSSSPTETPNEYYGQIIVDERMRHPSSPSSLRRGQGVEKKVAPPLLKRREKKQFDHSSHTETVQSSDPQSKDPHFDPLKDPHSVQKQESQDEDFYDNAHFKNPPSVTSEAIGSPPLHDRASGIYRRGVYVNCDIDKNRQLLLQRQYRMDSKSSQHSATSMDSMDSTIYDNPVPVSREDGDTSSDDEEPIYYNILLMKKHSLDKVSMSNH